MWSLTVCVTLIAGSVLTVMSSEIRSRHCDTTVIADPMAGVYVSRKLGMFMLFAATYTCTWMYNDICGGTEVVVSSIECPGTRGPSLFPVLEWTVFVFVWINAIGFVKLVRSY
ncbi:hypothetical protein DPEC_G00374570 [Dallia pectoralis]|nr:hypothetical protein DPEC_G00374570 [Dallia pectoralis]